VDGGNRQIATALLGADGSLGKAGPVLTSGAVGWPTVASDGNGYLVAWEVADPDSVDAALVGGDGSASAPFVIVQGKTLPASGCSMAAGARPASPTVLLLACIGVLLVLALRRARF
jgi:hypothetical protein